MSDTIQATGSSRPWIEAPGPVVPIAAGAELGPYRVESSLGSGGMGEVWLARRSDGLFEAPVALKLLHAHLQTTALRERFVREGRILGQLSHPHIARLLDAGCLPDQRLYLAIEYVEGQRIDHWCDVRKQTVAERVRLFLQVCDAVSHAHARLTVHRDLKPSNILVTPRGDIKLLDFGVAKLLETEKGAEMSELTRLGGDALTPEYAAPEQILRHPITVATDVYSLGMVLYVLLAGRRAYGDDTTTPAQLERAAVELEPPPPSGSPRTSGTTLVEDVASLRGTTPAGLRDALRGDLDTIVLKALKKNPGERYPSVAAFADDLRCHLEDRPVSAQPDSAAYRARKYVRRHRLGVAAGAAIAVAVVAGVSGVLFQAHEAKAARAAAEAAEHRATLRSEEADDLIGFMLGDLKQQLEGLGRLDLLDSTVAKAMTYLGGANRAPGDTLALQRRTEALVTLDELHTARGQFADAVRAGRQAVESARALRAVAPSETADELLAHAIYALGEPALEDDDFEHTLPLTREGLAIAETLLATPTPARTVLAASLHDQFAYILAYGPSEDSPGAEAQWQRCVDLLRPTLERGTAAQVRYLMRCESAQVVHLFDRDAPPGELTPVVTQAVADGRFARRRFPDNRAVLGSVLDVMTAGVNPTSQIGREADAIAVAEEGLAIARQLYAFEPQNIDHLRNLSYVLRDRIALDTSRGRVSPAPLRAEALEAARHLAERDPEHIISITAVETLTISLVKQIVHDPRRRTEAAALVAHAPRPARVDGLIRIDLEPVAVLDLLGNALGNTQPPPSGALDALRALPDAEAASGWEAARAYAAGHVAEGDRLYRVPVSTGFVWVVRWLRDSACAAEGVDCAAFAALEDPRLRSSPGTARTNGSRSLPSRGSPGRRVTA